MIGLAEASIHIDAPQAAVFDLFTTERGLRSWMAREASIDLRPGGRWRWIHDDDSAVAGEYVEIEPHDRLVFTYGWEAGPFADMGPGSTTVEVTFTPSDGGTAVRVAHRAVPEEFRSAHQGGWTYFLGVLATVAEGGVAPQPRLPSPPDAQHADTPHPDAQHADTPHPDTPRTGPQQNGG